MKALSLSMLLLASVAMADPVVVDLPYPELKLKNGKVLQDARITSFDPLEETATIVAGKNMTAAPFAWLPENVVTQLRELAPPPKTAEQLAAREKTTKERERQEADRRSREERRTEQAAQKTGNAAAKEEAVSAQSLATVASLAETRARNYFRYEYNKGSGLKFRPELEMEAPEPVAGWPRRYRVSGKAYVQTYANQGGFDSSSRSFDIQVEFDAKGRARVIDFMLK